MFGNASVRMLYPKLLPYTMVDLHDIMVNLLDTIVDLFYTMVDFLDTMVDLPN